MERIARQGLQTFQQVCKQIEFQMGRSESRRNMLRLVLLGAAAAYALFAAKWLALADNPLPVASIDRPDSFIATTLLAVVPWIFWFATTVAGLTAAWLGYEAFTDKKELLRFARLLIWGAAATCFAANGIVYTAGYFNARFNRVELVSMQTESQVAEKARHLTVHEDAVLLSALSGDGFGVGELTPKLSQIVSRVKQLEPVDQCATSELLRAALLGGTRLHAIRGTLALRSAAPQAAIADN